MNTVLTLPRLRAKWGTSPEALRHTFRRRYRRNLLTWLACIALVLLQAAITGQPLRPWAVVYPLWFFLPDVTLGLILAKGVDLRLLAGCTLLVGALAVGCAEAFVPTLNDSLTLMGLPVWGCVCILATPPITAWVALAYERGLAFMAE